MDCLEQGSRGSILQFMPFTTVSASPLGWSRPTFQVTRGAARFSRGWGSALGEPSEQGGDILSPEMPRPQESPSEQLSVCLWQVSELVKVSAMSSPKVVLAITDLSLPLGRQVAAKAIAAL